MSGFFDDSHVTNGSLQGSAGPSVGFGEMVSQGYRQQFRVDSALALNNELQNRWLESLRAAQMPNGRAFSSDEDWAYIAMAQHVKGQPVDVADPTFYFGKDTPEYRLDRMKAMIDANEAIKKLNNPEIKSFEQILEEVAQMQHEVEGETASMWERSGVGGVAGSFIGAMGGSFTVRDPLNLATIPLGYGRTIATRVAVDMGIAAGVVGATEILQVAPAREVVGLPERNPLYNIAAAAVGAGVIRGGIEGAAYGVRHLRGSSRADDEDIDFDLRDSQLAEMFAANDARPSARAGASILDDTRFIERNNPYGEGRAASERFVAELQSVQRAMNAEPMTAVARVMPPIPYEQVKKAADFEIVREQAPQLYARMEAAQARLAELSDDLRSFDGMRLFHGSNRADLTTGNIEVVRAAGASKQAKNKNRTYGGFYATRDLEEAQNYAAMMKGNSVYEIDLKPGAKIAEHGDDITRLSPDVIKQYRDQGFDVVTGKDIRGKVEHAIINPEAIARFAPQGTRLERPQLREAYWKANQEYAAAYRDVEAETVRIREQQTRAEASQQSEASNIVAEAFRGRPFVGPLLRYDSVGSLVDRINAFNDTLDEATAVGFAREAGGEEGEALGRETWRTEDGRIDISLREPVDPDFRVPTEDGDITVAAAMRDLQDDADLVEAIKVCSI